MPMIWYIGGNKPLSRRNKMFTPEEALALAVNSPNRDKGADAFFIRLNNNWGLKYFHREIVRNNTYILQKMTHDIGLAPAIGQKMEFDMDREHWYGYLTECVTETVQDYFQLYMLEMKYDE
jgi:hypothetical protein